MKDYLLEIGTEEIPAAAVDHASKDLENKIRDLLEDHNLDYDQIISYHTPRRLSLIVSDLEEYEEEKHIEQKGPSEEIAYGEDGQASKALLGFMKSQGVEEEEIIVKEGYIYANKIIEAQHISEIFKDSIPEIISKIEFPRTMNWHSSDFSFIRPVRWIVSLYGDQIIDLNIKNIPVSNLTKGHRFLGSQELEITSPRTYEGQLKANYVIPDPQERREIIIDQAQIIASCQGGHIHDESRLLDELVNIVEYPTAIAGQIKEDYLSLPSIVITTAMKEHLRFIPLYEDEESDKLLPYFISIVNGTADSKDIIIKGNEKVLGARLQDAKFFYEEDLEKDLDQLAEDLDQIIYHEKLGTMKLKVERLLYLVEKLGDQLYIADVAMEDLKRATEISKSDLLTGLVGEFPELQGVMGAIYASHEGEPKLVCKAIEEQYMPRHSGGDLPTTTVGSILSIADKLDEICGMFAVAIKPTGSQDPYGLRRDAIGIINIILENAWTLDIREAIDNSLYSYVEKNSLVFDYETVKEEIFDFFNSRIRVSLLDKGYRYDLIDAVLDTKNGIILNVYKEVDYLSKWIEEGKSETLEALRRINNITDKHANNTDFDESIFNDYERNLLDSFYEFKENVKEKGLGNNYPNVLMELESLTDPINQYFDNVLVFDDDENIKNNRLAFLNNINNFISSRIFNFSRIVEG